MNNELKNIATINIVDTEFEEENDGVVIVKSFGDIKIGLSIAQRNNGDAVLWFDANEAQQIIYALQVAIEEIKDGGN
ncbi:hypothetical protein [Clostridium sp. HMP27]|uniref:hypothetical protein n=1 Tax=Clostridium sp. HMP27 TaxID=1487921 RepID=UPI00052E4882|nr:hypothetical protein [Clostridium sp. HMP27]KGK81940.1 hypothetical protein DP68_17815 [Clostridium sp. HMP27]